MNINTWRVWFKIESDYQDTKTLISYKYSYTHHWIVFQREKTGFFMLHTRFRLKKCMKS